MPELEAGDRHAGQPAEKEATPLLTLLDCLFLLLKRWQMLTLGLAAGVAVGLIVWFSAERVWQSECTLLVERYGSPAQDGDDGAPVGPGSYWLDTEALLISSEIVLRDAARRLGNGVSERSLARCLRVERVAQTSLLLLAFRGRDPQFARDALAAIAAAYQAHFLGRTQSYAERLLAWMKEQEPRLRREMLEAEKERLARQRELGLFSQETPLEVANQRIRTLDDKITGLRIRQAETEGALAAFQKFAGSAQSLLIDLPEARPLAALIEHQRALAEDLAAKTSTLGPNHPEVAAVKARIERTNSETAEASRRFEEALRAKLATTAETVRNMDGLLQQARQDASDAVAMSTELEELRRREQHTRNLYEPHIKRLAELDLSQNFQTGWVQVVTEPSVPTRPRFPSVPLVVFIMLVIGVLLGGFLVFLCESLDDSVKMAEDVLRLWRLPVMGFVPRLEPLPDPRNCQEIARSSSAGVEALRMLAIAIDTVASRQKGDKATGGEGDTATGRSSDGDASSPHGRTIVFSSPGVGEGKTLLTFCTGLMLAHGRKKVLLVDADIRRRGLSRLMDMSSRPGMNAWFRHQGDISEYVERGPVEGLDVLPAGRWQEGPALIFRRDLMWELLDKLRGAYDYALVDVPAVSFISDALALAGSGAQMLLIARMGMSSKRLLKRCRELAETTGSQVVGLVINEEDARGAYYYRYYRYYYPYRGHEYRTADEG